MSTTMSSSSSSSTSSSTSSSSSSSTSSSSSSSSGASFWVGPHRFAYPSHPCRGSGPFLINLLALNSDGGSYECNL